MALVQTTLPGLYNGVSQQPPTLRLENQAELQENALGLLADGLLKRPNTEFVKALGTISGFDFDSYIHFIDRDETERYIVIITKDSSNPIRVFTLDGTEKTVNYSPQVLDYLKYNLTNPHEDLKCISIADHTFILNKNVVVKSETKINSESGQYPNSGVVFVKRGLPNTSYTIEVVVGTEKYTATYKTPENTEEYTEPMFSTEEIAQNLENELKDKVPSNITVSRNGSCVFIDGANFGLSVRDSYGNQALQAAKGKVQKFSDLPPEALPGTRIAIAGVDGSARGQYYVKFVPVENGQGYWEETYKEKDDSGNYLPTGVDPLTMPIKLVRNADGTFTLSAIEWKSRIVGDDESAPLPSFVGDTISDIFFFKNRFGVLSGDNVVLSEAGEYYNFFPNTVTDVLDGDPIDVSVLSSNVISLKYAVPLTTTLLLYSHRQQFILSGAGILSAVTVAIDHNAYHTVSTACAPKAVGPSVFFVSPKGDYSSLREYYIQPDITTNDAEDVTAHVPKYLPNNIKKIEANISTNTLFLLPSQGDALYTYTYYWEGDQKVQSAWGKWLFPSRRIIGLAVVDNWLYLITKNDNDNQVLIEKMNLEQGATTPPLPYRIHLDNLVKVKGVYNSDSNITTWTVPYSLAGVEFNLVESTTGLALNNPRLQGTNQIQVDGNYGDVECFIGIPYVFRYKFSQWYVRDEHGIAVTQGTLQVRNLVLSYVDTGYFKVKVLNGNREHSTEFTGATLGGGLVLGRQGIDTGTKRVHIGGFSDKVSIEIINDSYMPCRFQVASYEGFWVSRARRI